MKQIVFCIGFIFVQYLPSGLTQKMTQIGNGEKTFSVSDLNSKRIGLPGLSLPVIDTVYNQDLADSSGRLRLGSEERIQIRQSALVIGFTKNLNPDPVLERNFEATAAMTIRYKKNGSTVFDSIKISLDINYFREAGKNYKAKDYVVLDSVMWASVQLDSFRCNLTEVELDSSLFSLGFQILGLEDIIPTSIQRSEAITDFQIIFLENTSNFTLRWKPVLWAKSYDLEWQFVDVYSSAEPTFRNNSTRINVDGQTVQYTIPIISTKATFRCRIRPVGVHKNESVFNGRWSDVKTKKISGNQLFEQDKKPWQYIASYAENGMRKDLVSFTDGSGRERQKISRLNTNGNHLIIGETYYDHQGRPVVQSLATPYKTSGGNASSTSSSSGWRRPIPSGGLDRGAVGSLPRIDSRFLPRDFDVSPSGHIPGAGSLSGSLEDLYRYLNMPSDMSFIPKFNEDEHGNNYDRQSFDLDPEVSDCKDPSYAKPLKSTTGAGKYYSTSNDFDELHSAYTPDAQGYPIVQVEYTPDQTGRIRRNGLAGKEFQLGSGHETKYYYSAVSQAELFRMFGHEAGDASKYLKVIMQDADGQLHVSYQNSKAQTIATALAGETPSALQSLTEKEAAVEDIIDVMAQSNSLQNDGAVSIASQTFFVEQNASNVRIQYILNPTQFNTSVCHTSICYDCPKSLRLKISNSCGQIVLDTQRIIGPLNDPDIMQCNRESQFRIDANLILDQGEYYVEKILKIIDSAQLKYALDFIRRDTACYIPSIPAIPPCITTEVCKPCRYLVTDDGVRRELGNDPLCKRNCPGVSQSFDVSLFESLLQDMIPGAQYACVNADSTTAFKVSIFNPANLLFGGNWYRSPGIQYLNEDGSQAWIDVTAVLESYYNTDPVSSSLRRMGGRKFIRPNDILDLNFLKSIWKESWSEALVPFHPEYPYFLWNNSNIASIQFDLSMRDTIDYNNAMAAGFFREDEVLDLEYANRDPFFARASDAVKNNFINKLYQFSTAPDGSGLSVYQSIRQSAFCNTPLYADPTRLRECLDNPVHQLNRLNPEGKHFAWNTFKGMYQSVKQKLIDQQREADLASGSGHRLAGRIVPPCINANNELHCANCTDRDSELNRILRTMDASVNHARCASDTRIPSVDGSGIVFSSPAEAEAYFKIKLIERCNIHPRAYDFMNLLNALVVDFGMEGNKLTSSSINLNGIPPLVLPVSMVRNFPNKLSRWYSWHSRFEGRNLKVEIKDELNSVQSGFTFSKTDTASWQSIQYFGCVQHVGRGSDLLFVAFANDTHRIAINLTGVSNLDFSPEDALREKENARRITGKNKLSNNNTPISCCIIRLSPKIVLKNECERSNYALFLANVQRAKLERAHRLFDSIQHAYAIQCIRPENEQLTITKSIHLYYYTLFYYDQAGNLTKTVPPKAVRLLPDLNQIHNPVPSRFPNHITSLSTSYKYNSFNTKIERTTPDGGTVRWCFDELGRNILTQDAVQASLNEAMYLIYDKKNRPVETGVCSRIDRLAATMVSGKQDYKSFMRNMGRLTTFKKEMTLSHYDKPFSAEVQHQFTEGRQKYLRNRIAAVSYCAEGTPTDLNYQHAFHMTYNIAGQMTELIQDFKELANVSGISADLASQHRYKKTSYRFDQITGNVKEIAYQQGKQDQFFHWYEYDADNRLSSVETGFSRFEPADKRDRDAFYTYYLHGSVGRVEIGKDHIQGLDLVYTINGWLKSINNQKGFDRDPGLDGGANGFLKDALANELNYFAGDYKAVRADFGSTASSTLIPDLFTGKLSAVQTFNGGFNDNNLHHYKYDQLNRLVQSRRNSDNAYAMNLSYDKNGNIKTLQRYDGAGTLFDNFHYSYQDDVNNRLLRIHDSQGQMLRTGSVRDLAVHAPGTNYSYDATGRLISDAAEGNMRLSWYANSKIKEMQNDSTTSHFTYDALGKRLYKHTGRGQGEYTIRDFTGNILAEYLIKDGKVILNDIPMYGAIRIGAISLDTALTDRYDRRRWNQYRGAKVFELKNQIGDVNVLLSDRRVPQDLEYVADFRKATDYFPFGMIMPGRDSSVQNYRFGFQGMEQDQDHKGNGNSYTTEFRQYDPRVGRWLSIDPMEEKYPGVNPYSAFGNNPINSIDPKGDDADDIVSDLNDLAGSQVAINEYQRDNGVYRRQRREVLRYNIRDQANHHYVWIAGENPPSGTTDPRPGRPGYDGVPENLIENNRILTEYNALLRERNEILLGLTQHILEFITENNELLNLGLSASRLNDLRNFGHITHGVNLVTTLINGFSSGFDIMDGAANLAARSPEDLEGRLHDASRIFDGVVAILGSVPVIGDAIPMLLTENFLENTGRALFRNALQANAIIDSERRTIPNCRWTLEGYFGIWRPIPGTCVRP
jgi:RHS repeat-associated protein